MSALYDVLKKIKNEDKEADFCFPGLIKPVKGKIIQLDPDMVAVEWGLDDKTYQTIAHPNNIVIIKEK